MSQETKSQAFHRLARNRVDALLDKARLFGQLSGPSYDWSPDEVWAYFGEITQALEQALARFQEQKRWKTGETGEGSQAQAEAPAEAEAAAPENPAEPAIEEAPVETRYDRRKRTIKELIEGARNDPEMLPEMLAMQREVIDQQQAIIEELKARCNNGLP